MDKQTQRLYEFGPFRLEVDERRLWANGKLVEPQPQHMLFEALVMLVENHGRLLRKEVLIDRLWPDWHTDNTDGRLKNVISELRKILEAGSQEKRSSKSRAKGRRSNESKYIETVAKGGYRFVAKVRKILPPSHDVTAVAHAEATQDEVEISVFLSYHIEDHHLVRQIADGLRRAELNPQFERVLQSNERQFQDEITKGMHATEACVVFVGAHGIDDWQRREIAIALSRVTTDVNFRLWLAFLPGSSDTIDGLLLPPKLVVIPQIDFRLLANAQTAAQQLAEVVKSQHYEVKGSPELASSDCPYRGLQTFNEEHASFFFGREAEIRQLVGRLGASRFLAVIGPSGSGKSSLVRAGLIPRLGKGALPDSELWAPRVFKPGAEPLLNLAAQMLHLPQNITSQTIHELVEQLGDDDRALYYHVVLAFASQPKPARVLWVVDQFEEVFTLCSDEKQRTQFIANLLHAATAPEERSVVALALRADFYHKCAAYPELAQLIADHQLLVSPLTAGGLRAVMEKPAWSVGLAFEAGLAESILADLENQPGALPLLEHTLLELWNRRHGGLLTNNAYHEVGRVKRAIAQRADTIYEEFSHRQQKIARRIMLRLTRLGDGTEDTRHRESLGNLVTNAEEKGEVERIIQVMAGARLLTTGSDLQTGEVWVEVSHETLIRNWPRLRTWLDEDRQGRRIQERLTDAAKEWQSLHRASDALWSGFRLEEAVGWGKNNTDSLNHLEWEFLDASLILREEERRSEQRRRILQYISPVLLLAVIVISGVAIYARLESKKGLSLGLAAYAFSRLETDPELSLLLAIEANRVAQTIQAEDALRSSLLLSRVRARLIGHEAPVTGATFSPDGARIVTASFDRTAYIWRVADQVSLVELRGHARQVYSARFSPDGKRVVTASVDCTARVWDALTGEELIRLSGHADTVNNATFSPDGKFILTASGDKTARIWDAQSGQSLVILRGHSKHLNAAVFSSDGKLVVTASGDKTARVWEAKSGKYLVELNEHKESVISVAFSHDGKFVATASLDNTARIWEVGAWKTVLVLPGHTLKVTGAEFSHDDQRIITASGDGTARVWEANTGRMVFELLGHKGTVNSAMFSPQGDTIVTAGTDTSVRIWEANPGRSWQELRGHSDGLFSAAFSPDGKWVVTASRDKTARLWDVSNGQLVRVLAGHQDSVQNAAFGPDGKWIATASKDKTARIWETGSDKSALELQGHESIVHFVSFSPDGQLLATASGDKTARLWQAQSGRFLTALRGHDDEVNTVAFSPDGKRLVTASSDQTIRIWAAPDWREEWRQRVDTGVVNSAQFSPNGDRLVGACGDNAIRVWNMNDRLPRLVAVLRGHTDRVNSAEFSHDGRWIVSASFDRTARIWVSETWIELRGHTGSILSATFDPKSRLLVTASQDKTAKIYQCEVCAPIEQMLTLAGRRVTRALTQEEKEKYLYGSK